MTEKQAQAYVRDPENWKLKSETPDMRMLILTYAGYYFAQYQVRHHREHFFKGDSTHSIEWRNIGIYEYQPDIEAAHYSLSETAVIRTIWDVSRGKMPALCDTD